jgi:hypothetical protein
LSSGEYVAVDVECERDGGVVEALGCDAHVRVDGEQMRRV